MEIMSYIIECMGGSIMERNQFQVYHVPRSDASRCFKKKLLLSISCCPAHISFGAAILFWIEQIWRDHEESVLLYLEIIPDSVPRSCA
jgi:hypothetical protein